MQENPDARSYRTRSLPNYNDLFLIYGNATNKDMQNQSGFFIDDNDYELGVRIGMFLILLSLSLSRAQTIYMHTY